MTGVGVLGDAPVVRGPRGFIVYFASLLRTSPFSFCCAC